ncbi:sigma-70 family RNA polymerase sigma factor [Candidatus Desantisbacteria bacterium]|nr:sigma-70 family RNA polymerase sigma factor [Candidatus Desantisbacteria bacterium]
MVKLAQEGNEEAWSSLVKHYSNLVWFAISKFNFTFEIKEDILQEVFIRIADCIKMYNPDKASFSTFITVITKRKCIDTFRKFKKYNQEISIDSEKLFNIPENGADYPARECNCSL